MNPNGVMAAKPAPKMINDITPPYADALPQFAKPQPQAQPVQAQPVMPAEPTQPAPVSQPLSVPVAEAPAPVAAPVSPVTPMFPEIPVAPITPQAPAVSPMFEQQATNASPMVAEAPAPMADANLTAPIIAQPILPNSANLQAKKPRMHWFAIVIAIAVAAGLGAAAYLAFKQSS